jgi:tetratricopeptide (TPR) repeat protein
LIQAGAAYRDWLTFFPTDPLADDVMLKMAEAEMRQMGLADRDVTHARKAEQQLKVVLQQFPKTTLKGDVQQRLNEVQENLAMHNLQVAQFYYDRNTNNKGGLKGAQSRLLEITQKYPYFSYNDKVLYLLATTYMQEEEPDEAAKYFQQIARDYPNSEFAEKAKEQLGVIGAPVPDPDPIKVKMAPPVRPSFTESLMREVLGTTPVTISKDGVLLKADGGNDLLQAAIDRGGILPAELLTNPERRGPANRSFDTKPATAPANQQPVNKTPANGNSSSSSGLSVQPTKPGPPAGTTTPTSNTSAAPGGVPTALGGSKP